ncbi:extracellular solute-binding protein [Nocardioides sp. AE5]|uniref:ABC transporter substrate-binding protein n=1 Tax=Nocardioides sp. AE5 TaxID=2962573 RepID=UPI0028829D22|nr:extracellular solute-binding protein [Nocardioides sp. AE5]MDT0203782.1 extracellular solute-binding protein [Nocardioides sp. AE5]
MLRTRTTLACGALLLAFVAGACTTSTQPPKVDPTGSVADPVALTFLAYGPAEEVTAMESMVARFNEENPTYKVTLEAVDDSEDVIDRLSGDNPPDIYLLSQRDIARVAVEGLNQPIDELLDARNVDFSDAYKRDAIQAYSFDNHLQCMPYGVSPMVVYYNTKLVDFEAMAATGLEVPETPETLADAWEWNLEQFADAATWAANSAPGARGVYIEPSLEGLAPFIYSGGGKLFDNSSEPTTLAFSDGASQESLTEILTLLRTEGLAPSAADLGDGTALDMFKDGRLGMITGYRNLVPELRDAEGLSFDVMPMPTLDAQTTVGDVTGLCMAANPFSVSAAADFIAYAVAADSVAEVAQAGYLVPANNQVAEGEDFLQRDQEPARAEVFNASVRGIVVPPLLESWDQLEESVSVQVRRLFTDPDLDLVAITEEIDAISAPVVAQLVVDKEAIAEERAKSQETAVPENVSPTS